MFNLIFSQRWFKIGTLSTVVAIAFFSFARQAMAHHAIGGQTPINFFEGFVSGLAHPIIGLDHFAFVVATGAIAAVVDRGIYIPIVFILATLVGTAIHLQAVNLPFPEIIISASVVLFGIFLAQRNTRVKPPKFYGIVLAALAIVAGIFHGYAYGESIVGAQMTPLIAYLAGFAIIQAIVGITVWAISKVILEKFTDRSFSVMRSLGLAISAIGVIFLTASTIG
jgi:urease accessory protein